jgi:hypothetical protein
MNAWPVFSQNQGDIENNHEDGKSGSGEDHKTFDDTFSVALENNDGYGSDDKKLNPHICRNECKNYYGVTDANDGQVKEMCWKIGEGLKPIYEGMIVNVLKARNQNFRRGY